MNKKNIFLIILFLTGCLGTVLAQTVTSPDGRYSFTFQQVNDRLTYRLSFNGKDVTHGELGVDIDNHLVESAMGIPTDTNRVWTAGMRLTGTETLSKDTTWTPVYGEYAQLRDHFNQLTLHFAKGSTEGANGTAYDKRKQYLFDIIVRAYDEGVAIRYHFPEATNGLFMHITSDRTSFAFADGTEAWHAAWAQAQYTKVKLLKSEPAWRNESERPLLLRLSNGLYTAIGEAALSDFVRGKLKLIADNVLGMSMYDTADIITPYDMPWRVIMAGEKAVDLINNKQLFLNLNAPCRIPDTSWIRPGKAIRVTQLNMAAAMKCVDFAVDRGLQYIELDAGWYGPEMRVESSALRVASNRDFDMPRLCQYAREKGIGVWLYVNQRALWQQLDSILPRFNQWGVSGIKFGFVQVGSQEWTTWLHQAVEKCARYHIMVDIHDEYRPTGWSRTYPNLMTQEGVGGNEEMPNAQHNTVLPFTRFLCGPADYTPCYFADRVKNTHTHQLAMPVVYYSPITFLYWYDKPELYHGEEELDFWKHCPTVWDESIALDGEPGEYIVQARRSGNEWYVGAMNGLTERTVSLDTSRFLKKGKKYTMELYTDDPSLKTRTNVRTQMLTIKGGKTITLHLLPSGGAALRFVPTM
jgi:alpha-glucosidase